MKHSIKTELFVSVLILICLIFGGNLLVNNVLLGRYYQSQKQETLVDIYDELNEFPSKYYYQTDDFDSYFQQLSENHNIQIVILSADDFGQMHTVYESRNSKIMRGRIEGYFYGFDADNIDTSVLVKASSYIIEKCKDYSADNEFLECFGILDNECFFLMRSPLQSIRESVAISNRFLGYFLLISLAVVVLISLWMSEKITKPIKELTKLSEHMANLEFNVKYEGQVNNEIGRLGDNFNYLSTQLEKTISELKSANNELMNDLEEKTKIEEMRKEFLSNVTHELKTPIALIQGYAEGLKECINDDQESREFYCEVIMDEAAKMNHMVKMMLSLNHLESGRDMLEMNHFNLCDVINGVLTSTKVLADQAGCTVSFIKPEEPVFVWADEYKIEEVVTNYVSNAIHHVDANGRIEIKVEKNDKTARVTVFNTGKQIPETELENIWIKFYKVDKARTREYGGSGIGLSIVKAIMELHHQNYGVQNLPDGVAFFFEADCEVKGV